MPSLARLVITTVRNITEADIEPAAGFSLFWGDNGSGKTSVLEAIHLLGLGRSFRSHLQKPLITEGTSLATVFGSTSDGLALGIQRPVRGQQSIQIAGRKAESLAELSQSLPLQLINTDTFRILEGSPQERRRFMDWGVFHVEHQFLPAWRRAKLALQSRNMLLKQNASSDEIEPWTLELVKNADRIDFFREAYVQQLCATLAPYLEKLEKEQLSKLTVQYDRGWPADSGLYTQITQELSRDRKQGFTGTGPHRADLNFRLGRSNAVDVLSRGQLKLLVCALKVAQGKLLREVQGQQCIYLLDDLPAELDAGNRLRVCQLLADLGSQVFITCIEEQVLSQNVKEVCAHAGLEHKLFHVKHGRIAATPNHA
jgi:DNA replication and repair protein RecF